MSAQDVPNAIADAITGQLAERGTNGLAIAAFDAEGTLYSGGFGLADVGRREEVSPETVFRVASVSKLLTTATALRAVEAGRVDLDAMVNTLVDGPQRITDRSGTPSLATLRSLLSHSSGLTSSVRGNTVGPKGTGRIVDRISNGPGRVRDLRDAVTGLRVDREPGDRVVYANSGMNMVGYLAARAFETSFEEAARREVLEPLGMSSSAFESHRLGPGAATTYGRISPPAVGPTPASRLRLIATPMGGLSTTVGDLARFGRMVLGQGLVDGQRLLAKETVAEALSIQARNHPDLEQGFGLGFRLQNWRGHRLASHDGNMPGVSSRLVLAPDAGVGVVVLTNGFALGVPHQVAMLAMEELLGGPPEPAPVGQSPANDHLVGKYRLQSAVPPGFLNVAAQLTRPVTITKEPSGALRVVGNDGADGWMRLHPTNDPNRFRIEARVDDGTNAVAERGPDGLRLYLSYCTTLARR